MVGPAALIISFGRIELFSFLTDLGYGYMVGLWRRPDGNKDGWMAMAVVIVVAVADAERRMQMSLQSFGRFRLSHANPQAYRYR